MGNVKVPASAYYGAQTQRALDNFQVSGLVFPRRFIRALGIVKHVAAHVNMQLGLLDQKKAKAIAQAAQEVTDGKFDREFLVDIFQTGSGTSTNMNANEVIANRAIELQGGTRGDKRVVHPNDDVNMSQSSNDVFPTAIHISAVEALVTDLLPALKNLALALDKKADEFSDVVKPGRTHLQDAVPITLGQEFSGYQGCLERAADWIETAANELRELNLGATAVGTGLNAGDQYVERAVANLSRDTGLTLRPAKNLFRVTQSMGDVAAYSGSLRRLAVELGKIASDLRLLSMGPRAGLSEITLPAVQPGSSIMPGKVNPSVPEMVNQVCFQAIGCDATVAAAAEAGQLELNVMMPVIAWNAIHASTILREAMIALRTRTVEGIEANAERCRELLDWSTAAATALSPYIGYAATADIAKEAVRTGRPIREIVLERGLLDAKRLDAILSVEAMTKPGIAGKREGR